MDESLKSEMREIIKKTDEEHQIKSITKILNYLLTLPIELPLSDDLEILFQDFLRKAFELLPSSVLPRELSNKINIDIDRKRRVSFSNNTSFFQVSKSEMQLSQEGRNQQQRESMSTNITYINSQGKYYPTKINPFPTGMPCETQNISLFHTNLVNRYKLPQTTVFDRKFTVINNKSIEEILSNISLFKNFE